MRVIALALVLALPTVTSADAQSARAPLVERLAAERDPAVLEQALRDALRALPGVREVEVALTLTDPANEPLDAPLPPDRASVAITLEPEAQGTTRSEVEAALRRVLRRDEFELWLTRERAAPAKSATPTLVEVGPFRVETPSALALRLTLALSLGANALLALVLIVQRRRARSTARPQF